MSRSITRKSLSMSLVAVVAAVLCWAALGATALGAPGDTPGTATLLNDYYGSSLTTNLVVAGPPLTGTGFYWFRVDLSAGDTFRADFTSSPSVLFLTPATEGLPAPENVSLVKISDSVSRLTFTAHVAGMHSIHVGASTPGTFTVAPRLVPPVNYVPIAGSSRYDTAVQISKKAFTTADTVVVTTGLNWPDALGGAALANAYAGPILLTDPNALPSSVMDEIDRLGATKAIILGGSGSVSTSVETALTDKFGPSNVRRIGGQSRYQTASLIASETVAKLGSAYGGWAFVTTGGGFADALAASPIAAAKGWPIFLVASTGLDQTTIDTMNAKGITDVVILGGTGAVSTAIENDLTSRLGAGHVLRKQGGNRYATANAVATFGVEQAGLAWNKMALTTGLNFPDALAGGVLQGRSGSVMLLTPPAALDSGVAQLLSAKAGLIDEVRYLGGTGSVSQNVRNSVAALLR
jgi:putative cell wall-binding protein